MADANASVDCAGSAHAGRNCSATGRGRAHGRDVIASFGAGSLDYAHKFSRAANQRIPKWAYLLFIILAAFVAYRILQHRAAEIKTAQAPARPVTVAKAITKDVPIYLDEIGTCAAYETVQVQAQVSGKIISRQFQDGSDVKKGDPLFTIDPRPYQAVLDQAKAQAALHQVTLKRQEDLRARN